MTKVHVGTMGWSYDFWVGNFYPLGAAPDKYLSEYSKNFDTVEVDSTFYRIPYENTVTNWKDQTPDNFLFSVKFPRVITHVRLLKNCRETVNVFIRRVSKLENKLGPLLIQLPYEFKPEHIQTLSNFITNLPQEYRYVVEVRNKKLLGDELYTLLRKDEVALALVDHPFMPRIETLTGDFIYIRLEGDRRKVKGTLGETERDRTTDIRQWAEKIKTLLPESQDVFVYISKYYSGYPPTDAMNLLRSL